MADLKQIILDMSKVIVESTSIEGTEVVVNKDAKPYEQCMTLAGVTIEQATAVRNANRNYMVAATHALGQQTTQILANNPELSIVKAQLPMLGNDHVAITQHRERVFPNPQKPEETTTVVGALSMSVKTNIGKCADMKAAMEAVQLQAMELFNNTK